MYYIETTYGNDGFSIWVKTLRALATTNYHYLDLSNKKNVMFLASKCKVTEEILFSVLTDLSEMNEIDKELWYECRVVWSDKFIESIKDAYKKRSNEIINREKLLLMLVSLGVRKLASEGIKVPVNPHTKVEYTILKETIEEESKEEQSKVVADKSATIEQRAEIFMEKVSLYLPDYPKEMLRRFYDYWTEKNEGGRKMRFEMQKVFDIKRRLTTWSNNEKVKINGTSKEINGNIGTGHINNLVEGHKRRYHKPS